MEANCTYDLYGPPDNRLVNSGMRLSRLRHKRDKGVLLAALDSAVTHRADGIQVNADSPRPSSLPATSFPADMTSVQTAFDSRKEMVPDGSASTGAGLNDSRHCKPHNSMLDILGELRADLHTRIVGPAELVVPALDGNIAVFQHQSAQSSKLSDQLSIFIPPLHLKDFMRSHRCAIEQLARSLQLNVVDFATRAKDNDAMFATLVSMAAPREMFVHLFHSSPPLKWDLDTAVRAFQCTAFLASSFLNVLNYFNPVKMKHQDRIKITDHNLRIPLVQYSSLGEGHYGTVYAVRLRRECCPDLDFLPGDQDTLTCAMKVIEGKISGDHEWLVMADGDKGFSNQPDGPGRKFIMMALSCVSTPLETYIFYPRARYNLREYMNVQNGDEPSAEVQTQMIEFLGHISSGLGYLLRCLRYVGENHPMCLIHMDIKLQNILIVESPSCEEIAQIADFGNAATTGRAEEDSKPRVMNISRYYLTMQKVKEVFAARLAQAKSTASPFHGTLNRLPGNNFAHFPPEALGDAPLLSAASSIWQLGALIAFVLPWLRCGTEGLAQVDHFLSRSIHLFEIVAPAESSQKPDSELGDEHHSEVDDAEWIIDEKSKMRVRIKPGVDAYFTKLVEQAHQGPPVTLHRTQALRTLLQETLRCNPKDRASIEKVQM